MKTTTLALFFFCQLALAAPSGNQVKKHMNVIEKNLINLIPLAIDSAKFTDKQNNKLIEQSLGAIQNHLVHAGTHLQIHSPGQKTLRKVLQSHLDDAHQSFTNGHFEYSRRMVLATVELCTRCHTQDNKARSYSLNSKNVRELPAYQQALFLMGTRRYREAKEKFEEAYKMGKNQKIILRNLIEIQFRLGKSPQKIANYLAQFKIPKKSLLGSDVMDWTKRLKGLNPKQFSLTALKRLEKEIEKNMTVYQNPRSEIDAIYLLYLLGKNHSQFSKLQASEKLYKMAIIDNSLNQTYFFSPSLSYLETCIEGYPGQSYASKCLGQYETLVKNSFTGSAGMDLPKEVQKKFEYYRGLILKHKKK